MAWMIYSARNGEGKPTSGVVEANSAQEALTKLQSTGLRDITLHDDPGTGAMRADLAGLSAEEASRIADFELRVRKAPTLANAMAEVSRQHWLSIGIDVAIVAWGLATTDLVLIGFGSGLLAFTFGLPLWRFRHAQRYNELLRAMALGNWAQAELLLAKLRNVQQQELLKLDLDIREATIMAARGQLPQALATVERWRAPLAAISPGLFSSRVASIYHAAGDYRSFVQSMQSAHADQPDDPARLLDLAVAEARVGDTETAEELLKRINLPGLPALGRPFVHWAHGLIALRRNAPEAQRHLTQAMAGFLEYETNPSVWITLALCSGAYVAALARDGQLEGAHQILQRVWPVLMVHGDRPLLTMIRQALQAPSGAG